LSANFGRSASIQRELNKIDPYKVWTWDRAARTPDPNSTKRQLPMWHRYRVEMYPHVAGRGSGLVDAFGNQLEFPAAFRRARRADLRKGILQIVQESAQHGRVKQ
jgi:hypothetical protein